MLFLRQVISPSSSMQDIVVAIAVAGTATGATMVGHLSDQAGRRRMKSRRERAD